MFENKLQDMGNVDVVTLKNDQFGPKIAFFLIELSKLARVAEMLEPIAAVYK